LFSLIENNQTKEIHSKKLISSTIPLNHKRTNINTFIMSKPAHVESSTQFDELLANNTYVLIDFTASWCPPCKMIAPIFEQLSITNTKKGSLAFAKVDVDEQREIAAKYRITAMPTFILVKDGEQVETVRGANPPAIQNLVKTAVTDVEKTAADAAAAAAPKADAAKEEETVSGTYTMSSNANWKTAL
jgi:thioredoxin 1